MSQASVIDVDALAAFVRDRNEEDRAAALAATRGPWSYNPSKAWFPFPEIPCELRADITDGAAAKLKVYAQLGADEYARARYGEECAMAAGSTCVAVTGPADDPQSMADAAFIARNDPRAALAQCAAADGILADYEDVARKQREHAEEAARIDTGWIIPDSAAAAHKTLGGIIEIRFETIVQVLRHVAMTWSWHPEHERIKGL